MTIVVKYIIYNIFVSIVTIHLKYTYTKISLRLLSTWLSLTNEIHGTILYSPTTLVAVFVCIEVLPPSQLSEVMFT